MEAECPSPAGSKHITPLLKHFSPSAGHRFPYRYHAAPPPPPLSLPPMDGNPPLSTKALTSTASVCFPSNSREELWCMQRHDMRRLSAEAAQTETSQFILFYFFHSF